MTLSCKFFAQESKIYSLLDAYLSASKIDSTIESTLKSDSCYFFQAFQVADKKDSAWLLNSHVYRLKQLTQRESADTIEIAFNHGFNFYKATNKYLPTFAFTFAKGKREAAKDKFNLLDKKIRKVSTKRTHEEALKHKKNNDIVMGKRNKHVINYILPRSTFPTVTSVSLSFLPIEPSDQEFVIIVQFLD